MLASGQTRNRQREPAVRGRTSFIHISDARQREKEIRPLRAYGPKAVGILTSHSLHHSMGARFPLSGRDIEDGGWERLARKYVRDLSSTVDRRKDTDAVAPKVVKKDRVLGFRADESDPVFRVAHEAVPCEDIVDFLIWIQVVHLAHEGVYLFFSGIRKVIFKRVGRAFLDLHAGPPNGNKIVMRAFFVLIWASSEIIIR